MLQRTASLAIAAVFAALVVVFVLLPTPVPLPPATDVLVIDNVRYFDGERLDGPAAITIRNGRVDAIDEPGSGPANATRLDASNKTLLPGLIDAHTHSFLTARRDALRFGVTTMLDMFTDPGLLDGVKAQRDDYDRSDSAALFSAGMLATVDGGHGTQYGIDVETLHGPADAPGWVAARVAEGSDFIKLVYMPYAGFVPSLDLATATAVIDAAHAAGLMAVAHVASLEGARDLLDAGIDGFVHVFADQLADDAFVELAAERGVFVVPTLAVIAMVDGQSTGPALIEDPDLGPRLTPAAATNLKQDFGIRSRWFRLDTALANVARLHAAGVPILAGSDAPNPGTAHGVTLHAEMALLVRAGLSTADALAAATSVPAAVFNTAGRGRIETGARADLLLVNDNPVADINATRAIDTVYRNGYALADETPRPSETTSLLAGTLGDFEQGMSAPEGLLWAETSDQMMGGSSTASIERVARRDGTALAIDATVSDGFAYPWAGVYLGPSADGVVGDLGDARAIAFDVRGTPAEYRLMLFVAGGMGAPPTAGFTVMDEWQRIEIPIASVAGFEPDRFAGLAIVTPMLSGEYAFEIDDVTLVP
jgi:imidazolonepropionase-like amidohydrolase